jgi:hypothetical protein
MGANRTALPRLTTAPSQRSNPVAPKGRGPRTSAPVPSRSQLPRHNPCISTSLALPTRDLAARTPIPTGRQADGVHPPAPSRGHRGLSEHLTVPG